MSQKFNDRSLKEKVIDDELVLRGTTINYLLLQGICVFMNETEERDIVGNSTHTHIKVGPPKFQTTVQKLAREELGIDDLEYKKGERIEKATLKATFEVVDVKEENID